MAAIGGSIQVVTLKGRPFAVAADAGANRKLGGFENATEPNGNGTSRLIKNNMGWKIDGLSLEIDDTRDDQEFLQGLADLNSFFTCLIIFVSGAQYEGQGQITGEILFANTNATAPIELSGTGRLTKQ